MAGVANIVNGTGIIRFGLVPDGEDIIVSQGAEQYGSWEKPSDQNIQRLANTLCRGAGTFIINEDGIVTCNCGKRCQLRAIASQWIEGRV